MLGDNISHTGHGVITSNIETDTSIQKVLDCLNLNLPHFPNEMTEIKEKTEMNEEGITQILIIFLQRKTFIYPFFFKAEDKEGYTKIHPHKVDVGVYSRSQSKIIIVNNRTIGKYDSFFKLEAKRLDKLEKAREREYVVGRLKKEDKYINSGGIERFKKGIHGRKLIHVGLIGYVQLHDFKHWFSAINGWISDLSKDEPQFWSKKELLKKESSKPELATYISYHLRRQKGVEDQIKLHHFWIDLQDKKASTSNKK